MDKVGLRGKLLRPNCMVSFLTLVAHLSLKKKLGPQIFGMGPVEASLQASPQCYLPWVFMAFYDSLPLSVGRTL